jgi:hypothetical protein
MCAYPHIFYEKNRCIGGKIGQTFSVNAGLRIRGSAFPKKFGSRFYIWHVTEKYVQFSLLFKLFYVFQESNYCSCYEKKMF